MSINLTPEQRRQLAEGRPVRVQDEGTNLPLVVLTEQLYAQLPEVPRPAQDPGRDSRYGSLDQVCPLHLPVRDLPIVPEIQQRIDEQCRRLNLGRGRYRREVEEELLLSFYFGGRWVAVLPARDGSVIVGVTDELRSPGFDRQLAALDERDRGKRNIYAPLPWVVEQPNLPLSFTLPLS